MIKTVIVGAGGIAQKHVEGLSLIKDVEIIGVIDTNSGKAQDLANKCGARVYNSMEECINLVDMVHIFTPPSTHRELAVKAMELGKHIVCEKPISISLEDARIMVRTAAENNVKLMIAFNMRFRKGFQKLKEIAESGKIGEVINFWSQRLGLGAGGRSGWQGYNWRTDPNLLCGMSIESLSHDIDLMRWIVGDIVDVRANTFESIESLPGFDDNANVVCTLANGGTAVIHASWSSYIERNSRGILGTKGAILTEGSGLWNIDQFRIKTAEMEYETIEEIKNDTLDVTSYYEENKHFVESVLYDKEPIVTGVDGLKALEISHAILISNSNKKVVEIKDLKSL